MSTITSQQQLQLCSPASTGPQPTVAVSDAAVRLDKTRGFALTRSTATGLDSVRTFYHNLTYFSPSPYATAAMPPGSCRQGLLPCPGPTLMWGGTEGGRAPFLFGTAGSVRKTEVPTCNDDDSKRQEAIGGSGVWGIPSPVAASSSVQLEAATLTHCTIAHSNCAASST